MQLLELPTVWDFVVMLCAFVFVVLIISFGELLRKKLNLDVTFTRKLIHLFAGFAAYTIPFYDHPWMAILVAVTFVVLLFFASPKSPVKALNSWFEVMADRKSDVERGHIYGPIYYSISISILVAVFTLNILPLQYIYTAAMGLTAMYWGDGLGAPVGKKYGKHQYKVLGTRSIEGSLAVLLGSIVGTLFAGWFFGMWAYPVISDFSSLLYLSVIASVTATLIEAVSPTEYDNFTIPFVVTFVVYLVGI
ncbi:MAG: hypothetical protein J7L47_08615 [Candidatus Odinarchaeota archaeon]|nr:hypothetical protein [Candidatus Odinarchaeota archaeon]